MTNLSALFQVVLRMSQAGAAAILLAALLRLCLRKAPKKYRFILWAAVLARLVCPAFPEAAFSPMPRQNAPLVQTAQVRPAQVETVQPEEGPEPDAVPSPQTAPPDPVITVSGAPVLPDAPDAPEAPSAAPVRAAMETDWTAVVWLAGCGATAFYLILSYWQFKRSLALAWQTEEGIWELDGLPGPFVLGLLRPRIYLPAGLEGSARELVLRHEQAHLDRRDHLVKPLACCVLAVHWFNPLVWLAFLLMSRDMEFACDERVLAQLGEESKADYSACLLSFAAPAPRFAGSPLAFGESNAKRRIRNVLSYKKPAFWLVLTAVLALTAAAAAVLTDPASREPEEQTARLTDLQNGTITWVMDSMQGLTYSADERVELLAADGPKLLLTTTRPIFEDSVYYSEEGYRRYSVRVFVYDVLTGQSRSLWDSGGQERELCVSGAFSGDAAVLSMLQWWHKNADGETYQYEVRRHEWGTDGQSYTRNAVLKSGPCTSAQAPALAALSDGSVVLCRQEPDGTGLTVSVLDGEGSTRFAHKFPEETVYFPVTLTSCGDKYLLWVQETGKECPVSFYLGDSGGALTQYAPEADGALPTGAYLLGEAMVYQESFYDELYMSSPSRTVLHALSPGGTEAARADVSGLAPFSVLASGEDCLLCRAGGELALVSIEDGEFVFRGLGLEPYGMSVAAPADGSFYQCYPEGAQRPGLVRVTPGPEGPEYSHLWFEFSRSWSSSGDYDEYEYLPAQLAAETWLNYMTGPELPEEARIDAYRVTQIVRDGDEKEFTVWVVYVAERNGSYQEECVRLSVRQSEENNARYEIVEADAAPEEQPEGVTLYEGYCFNPNKELIAAELPRAPVQSWEDGIMLLAEAAQGDIGVYYVPSLGGSYVALRYGEHVQTFEQTSLTPRFILPQVGWRDWDGDGKNELAVVYYAGSGTGVSVEELHIYEWNGGQWTDVPFDNGVLLDRVREDYAYEISEDGHRMTVFLESGAVELETEYHYTGFDFPGLNVSFELLEDGRFRYYTAGGAEVEELPWTFYENPFSAEGILTYDRRVFRIESMEITQ